MSWRFLPATSFDVNVSGTDLPPLGTPTFPYRSRLAYGDGWNLSTISQRVRESDRKFTFASFVNFFTLSQFHKRTGGDFVHPRPVPVWCLRA